MSVKLEDFAGSLQVDQTQACSLIKSWFNPDDMVVLSGKKVTLSSKSNLKVLSQSAPAVEFVSNLSNDFLASLCLLPEPFDIYINVGSPRGPLNGLSRRVTEKDLDKVIGVIGDFDIKDGGFTRTEDILKFLNDLELKPTIVVKSGSGGVHAWWKFKCVSGKHVLPQLGKDIAHRWWTHINSKAMGSYGAKIDKLVDTARMMRLPGTVHWPRQGAGTPSRVELVYADGPVHAPEDFLRVSENAWSERSKSVLKTREENQKLKADTEKYTACLGGGRWQSMLALSNVEDYFQENVSWGAVLRPAGWSYTRTDSQGRDEWARPGRSGEKSACVGWSESPHVMSLLSTSHNTGLLDLLDAEIPLTKWRVSQRLNFHDDYQKMVEWTLNLMRTNTENNGY